MIVNDITIRIRNKDLHWLYENIVLHTLFVNVACSLLV